MPTRKIQIIRRRRSAIGPRKNELSENFGALIDTLRAEGIAERTEEQREDRGKKIREWTTILLIAATLGAVSWQVHEMIKVYQPIKDQAQAAIKSADAAMKQAVNSERTLIEAQRAWVGPRNVTFSADPAVGKALEIRIEYQNSGHEPAIRFVYLVEPFAIEQAQEANRTAAAKMQSYLDACQNNNEWQGGSVIYPVTSGFGASGYSLNVSSKDDLVDDSILKGEKVVIVHGCFRYRTMGLPKHTYFCYFYKQGITKIQNLNICASGHDAD